MTTVKHRNWLLLMGFLFMLLGLNGDQVPYFHPLIWRGVHLFTSLNLIILYFYRERKWVDIMGHPRGWVHGVSVVGFIAANYERVGSVLAASTDPANTDIWTELIPQAGIFGLIIVVAKFFLGRQDAKDASHDKSMEVALEEARNALKEERLAHEATRQKLYDVLQEPDKESR